MDWTSEASMKISKASMKISKALYREMELMRHEAAEERKAAYTLAGFASFAALAATASFITVHWRRKFDSVQNIQTKETLPESIIKRISQQNEEQQQEQLQKPKHHVLKLQLQQQQQQQQQQQEQKTLRNTDWNKEDESQILKHPLVVEALELKDKYYQKEFQVLKTCNRTLESQLDKFEEEKRELRQKLSDYISEIKYLRQTCYQLQPEIDRLRKPQYKDPQRILIIGENQLKDKLKVTKGGFGEVYQVKYKDQLCAMKTFDVNFFDIKNQFSNNGQYFLQEIMNISTLVQESHPNICRTLACGLDVRNNNNSAFIISEWINGGDLDHFIKSNKFSAFLQQFPSITGEQTKQLFQFCVETVGAIDFLHQCSLMHCDLKPQNIFVRQESQNRISPIVADFGISIVMGDKTKKGTQILGSTERWMSYEYNYTDTVSPKTDVWSLGCLIFYVFSNGNLPYSKCRDGSEVAACIKEKKDFFDCVEQQAINDVAPVMHILQRCLVHDHEKRASIEELHQLLKNQLQKY